MSGLSYKDAGVDIATGNALIERIKPHIKRTLRKEVMSELGGFGGMMSIPEGYRQPILVSGTDGVGTKLRLAIDAGIYDTIGIDLVAMCVNDIIVAGAEPFMFLDYYATGKLDNDVAEAVVKGIADGCVMSGASLVGGETAEMPGMYQANDFDLAGFAVGVVEKAEVVTGETVQAGQRLIGLASSGPHSNGYSLIRKVIEHSGVQLDDDFDGRTYAQALLTPTTIYVKAMLDCLKLDGVHALAHITGGGLTENLPRVLPANTQAVVERSSWQLPGIFQWLQQAGGIADEEMLLTFNCGVGMVMVVDEAAESSIIECLSKHDLEAFPLGSIEASSETQPSVSYR